MTPPPTEAGSPAPRGAAPARPPDAESGAVRQGVPVGVPYGEKSTFQRGQLVYDRFKILRFIAKGGAGEVYEAQDLELRCPVALKVARPELADNEHTIERFRREIALARQVTHPNVCRIFDVFRCDLPPAQPGGEKRQTLFLTMELLAGESLAARIHRHGPMSVEDALPLVEGMVAGLEAAHRVGVIHRDFKSANVVLVEEAAGTRVVITDFGLARGLLPDESEPDITRSGTVVGTPNYMAPEQLTGGQITELVDMYALGIVMYEMTTGTRPFKGETDLSTAVKRLTEPPPSPRIHVPDLDPLWERVILRCLERDPDDRFPRLVDIPHALQGEVTPSRPPSIRRRSRRRGVWMAAVLVPLVLAVTLLMASFGDLGPPQLPISSLANPRVAVLDFRNLGETRPQVSPASMAWILQADLEEAGSFRPVARDRVVATGSELGIYNDGNLSSTRLQQLFQSLDVDLVVEGAYLELEDGQLHLQIRMHDRSGGVTTVTERGMANDHFDMLAEASQRLHQLSGRNPVPRPVAAPEDEPDVTGPPTAEPDGA